MPLAALIPSVLSCRARLSYEQFSQFLVAIKELNAGRTSREDTLGAAKALFGASNSDLYGELVLGRSHCLAVPVCGDQGHDDLSCLCCALVQTQQHVTVGCRIMVCAGCPTQHVALSCKCINT